MAKMIPPVPFDSDPASLEKEIFEVFEHKLCDPACDYVVFHSFKVSDFKPLCEIDFIVYHRQKGILCIESKAGKVSYENRQWKYSDGDLIHDGVGPYRQAENAKWDLINEMKKRGLAAIVQKCYVGAAVLFPSLSSESLERMDSDNDLCDSAKKLGAENNREVTLTKETLENPTLYISKLMDRGYHSSQKYQYLTKKEENLLFSNVFCPVFKMFSSAEEEAADMRDRIFRRFSREQAKILGFLEEQRIAAINGRAGTGKTVVAVEKAEMHARRNEKVLFICFNRNLRDSLEKRHHNPNIDFMTLDTLRLKFGCREREDFVLRLLDMEEKGERLGYDHVVVDEGQDFVFENNGTDILSCIQQLVAKKDADDNHSFYVFYDEFQLIQGARAQDLALPPYIASADCKLTLYRNCRNTLEIAKASLSPWGETPRMFEGMTDYDGRKKITPELVICPLENDLLATVDRLLRQSDYKPHEIVVITCSKVLDSEKPNASCLCHRYDGDKQTYSYVGANGQNLSCGCYTARTFKGLEAKEVILVDMTEDMFDGNAGVPPRLFYVASSRAKESLKVIVKDEPGFCSRVLAKRHSSDQTYTPPTGNQAKRILARELHMQLVAEV